MKWNQHSQRNGSAGVARPFQLWLCLALLLPPSGHPQAGAPSEYEVKAVWLLNFARFAEWPAGAFPSPQAPLVVVVVGRDPFGAVLEMKFAGKTVGGRPLTIKRLAADRDFDGCHIIFFSSSEKKRQRELMEKLRGKPVLTVGESDNFLDDGGMMQFVRRDDTIRFAVNLDPVRPARLKLSANLVKVAVLVKGKYE